MKSEAAILLEPELGFHFGGSESSDGKWTGGAIGGRVGYQSDAFLQLGFELLGGSLKFQKDTHLGEVDFAYREFGAFVGADIPGVRLWFTLVFAGSMESDGDVIQKTPEQNLGKLDFDQLVGPKFGISFKFLPPVYINLQYKNLKAKKGSYTTSPNVTQESDIKVLFLSVSLPLIL